MEIKITFQVAGVHRYKDCPIDEVSYLRDYHRHMFWFTCYKFVEHDDRDIEIIMFKRDVKAFIREHYFDVEHDAAFFGDMSCEMIAKLVYHEFGCSEVEVTEDNENGCRYKGLVL